MKRMLLILVLLLSVAAVPAYAEYWDASSGKMLACCDDRPGCQVLQTVMLGSFSVFDPADHVVVRIFSAALPRLCAVTEDDFLHFQKAFDTDGEILQQNYFIALANCLWADILITPQVSDSRAQQARTILLLFLQPPAQTEMIAQQQAIREASDEKTVSMIAESADVPVEFVRRLLESDGILHQN